MRKFNRKEIKVTSLFLALLLALQSIFPGNCHAFAKADSKPSVSASAVEETKARDELSDRVEMGINILAETDVPEQTPETSAPDMTVNDIKVLTEDTTVNNLNITYRYLDLNGCRLTVLGDIIIGDAGLLINGGTLICNGSCLLNNGSSYIRMNSQDDYVKICGDFTTNSTRNSTITAGLLEIQGDFNQTDSSLYASFCTGGTSEVLFSGSEAQEINFQSDGCYFSKVTLKNTSEEGIISKGLINSLDLSSNSTKVTCGTEGTFGWRLTEDETFTGDLTLIGGTLDLNGHTLNVSGDLIHANGTIKLSGGKLKVEGDYRMQRPAEDAAEGEASYRASVSNLIMAEEEDVLDVDGDIYAQSNLDLGNNICAGTIYAAGNVSQFRGRVDKNFDLIGLTLVMDGDKEQLVSYESDVYGYVGNLKIENEKGINLLNDMYIRGVVSHNGYLVKGAAVIPMDTTRFQDETFNGDIRIKYGRTTLKIGLLNGGLTVNSECSLANDLKIKGTLTTTNSLLLNNHRLEVSGDASIGNRLLVGTAEVDFKENLLLTGNGYLDMKAEGHVFVRKDMTVKGYAGNSMTAGILEIEGNFIQEKGSSYNRFLAEAGHTTVFSGTSGQTVIFADDFSHFGTVEIRNTSEEGVYAPSGINCVVLNKNGNNVTTDLKGVEGWTLKEDEEYSGDLYLTGGTLDLNGHTLTVSGNLIQSSGTVDINKGKLVVKGDYRIQSKAETDNGNEGIDTGYGSSAGYLDMTNPEDLVIVEGSFVMGSLYDHSAYLTKGTLKAAGDVEAVKYAYNCNFQCGKDFTLELNGTEKQNVKLHDSDDYCCKLGNLTISNSSDAGVLFENVVQISGEMLSGNSKVNGTILITDTTTFPEKEIPCDVLLSSDSSYLGDVRINGDLIFKSWGRLELSGDLTVQGDLGREDENNEYSVSLNGHRLHVCGNANLNDVSVFINKGRMDIEGNLVLGGVSRYGGGIYMDYSEDYVSINGSMTVNSYNSRYNAGTLELKGDFCCEKGFYSTGDFTVILSGGKRQIVTFKEKYSYFCRVEIKNTSQEGVYSEEGISCIEMNTNGNVYRTGIKGRMGWTLEEDQTIDGDLTLAGGVLDLNGHTLTVRGNFNQPSGNIKINGGKLIVEGDYAIESTSGAGAWAGLHMTDKRDRLIVKGDFITRSNISHSTYLTAGEMTIGGNLIQETVISDSNFMTSGSFTLVMNGTTGQSVESNTEYNTGFIINNLIIDNSSRDGVRMNSVPVNGSVTLKKGIITDMLSITANTIFEDNAYTGDILIAVPFTSNTSLNLNGNLYIKEAGDVSFNETLNVSGNMIVSNYGSLNLGTDISVGGDFKASCMNLCIGLNKYTFDVKGDIILEGAYISVENGRLLCGGDLDERYNKNYISGLAMGSENSYVLVGGNMYANSYSSSYMGKGTLEIKGDFINTRNDCTSFRQESGVRTVFSGTGLQTITMAGPSCTFGTLIINNSSREGVHFSGNTIKALNVEKNGNRLYCDGKGEFGWELSEDTVIEEDFVLIGDELNLNGHSFTVNGDLFLSAGTLRLNKGTLKVNGNFYIETYNESGEYTYSNASFIMTDKEDKVIVDGDFACASSKNSNGNLTAGTMEIHGDFLQASLIGAGGNSFVSTRGHTVVFNGKKAQTIYFSDSNYSYFNNVVFDNNAGVTFNSNAYLHGSVEDKNMCVSSSSFPVYVYNLDKIKDGKFGGSVTVRGENILTRDLSVGGVLCSLYTMDMNGYDVDCENYIQNNGILRSSGGRLSVTGDLTVENDGRLIMNNENDYLWIKGNLKISSRNASNLSAGILEVCGDITSFRGFYCTGTHRTILSGKLTASGRNYIQSINIYNMDSRFNELVLRKNDRCYIFNRNIDSMCRSLVYDAVDQTAPERVTGLTVTGSTYSTIRLSWNASTDDVGVAGYQVYRGTKLIGITDSLSFTDTGLMPESSYTYTVYAYDEAQNLSLESEQVIIVTKADEEAPSSPCAVKLVTRTGSSVTLAWGASRDNVKVTSYKIYRDGKEVSMVSSDVREYKDTGLNAGEMHSYALTAVDFSGNESEMSEEVSVLAQMPEITGIFPAGGSQIGGKEITLGLYYKNTGNSTGNKVRFEYSDDEGKSWSDINSSLIGQNVYSENGLYSTYQWDFSRLESGNYVIRATLYDADNNTDSIEADYRIDTSGPAAPDYIEAVSKNGVVTVSWSESASANCSKYKLYRSCEDGDFELLTVLEGRDSTSYADTDTAEGNTYCYYVICVDMFGINSGESEKAGVMATADEEAPSVKKLTSDTKRINESSVFVIDAEDNVGIVSFRVEYYDGEQWIAVGESENGESSVLVTGKLPEDGIYKFRGVAVDSYGNEGVGGESELTVDTTGVGKPSVIEVTSTSDNVRIVWEQPCDEDFSYYVVEQKTGDGYKEVVKNGETLGTYIRDLSEDTEYTFRIAGYDTAGNKGEYSDEITVRTKRDTTAPSIREFGPAVNYYRNSIPLSIQAVDKNALGTMTVFYSTDKEEWIQAGKITAPNDVKSYNYTYDLDISGLPEGEVYVKVELEDYSGNKYGKEVIRTFLHDLSAPSAMEDITAAGKDGYIEVRWGRPSEEDACSFSLYRMDNKTGDYKCIAGGITSINYIDTSISEDEIYTYKLRVNDLAGNTSEFSKTVMAKCMDDTTAPKVYGIAPEDKSVVGVNEDITVLVADNRRLGNVMIEYHKVGEPELWTEIYNEDIASESKTVSVKWNNENLDEGDYEIRVIAADDKGNVSEDYTVVYTYSRQKTEEGDEEKGDDVDEAIDTEKVAASISLDSTKIQRCGSEYVFSAAGVYAGTSVLDSFVWDFGDGSTAKGLKVIHTYEKEGSYEVVLTAEDINGNKFTKTTDVDVVEKGSGGISVSVKSESGEALSGAYVNIMDSEGKMVLNTTCGLDGSLDEALPSGTYSVAVYSSGHLPEEQKVKVTKGTVKKLDFRLKQDEVVVGVLEHRQLEVSEMIELGIDLEDEDNWYTHTYSIVLYENGLPTGKTYSFNLSRGGVAHFENGGRSYTCTTAGGRGGENVLVYYFKEKWLKQMFDVRLTLRNQAGKSFSVTNGEAELILPKGLSLSGMKDYKQSLKVSVPDIAGQSEQTVNWYIRGDEPGTYNLAAKFDGILLPFNAPVSAYIEDAELLEVTDRNENTEMDPGFTDPEKEVNYTISVSDYDNREIKGVYVVMEDEKGLAVKAITDSRGRAYFKVNKDDNRTFRLTAERKGYISYIDNAYKIKSFGYFDSIRLSADREDALDPFPEEKSGDDKLKLMSVLADNVNLAEEEYEVNNYTSFSFDLALGFNHEVSHIDIFQRKDMIDEYVLTDSKVDGNNLKISICSKDLKEDLPIYVRAVKKESGKAHVYEIRNLKVVHREPKPESSVTKPMKNFEDYDDDTAKKCILYSAIAYDTDFSYNPDKDCVEDVMVVNLDSERYENKSLWAVMKDNGYFVAEDYYRKNYGDGKDKGPDDPSAHNCSYSFFYKDEQSLEVSGPCICVVIRGTDSNEWYGNMDVTGTSYDSSERDHRDFKKAADDVYDNFVEFIDKYGLKGAYVLVTGHSRGGAVTNLLSKRLIDDKEELELKGVAAYAFATPGVTTRSEEVGLQKYKSIYNFRLRDDFVTNMPLKEWGYQVYGQTVEADSELHLHGINGYYDGLRGMAKVEKTNFLDETWYFLRGGKITYCSCETADLMEYMANNWKGISDYYNKKVEVYFKYSVTTLLYKKSLYEVMHDHLAKAARALSWTKAEGTVGLIADFRYIKFGELSRYFIGQEGLRGALFSTHAPDNYYAAVKAGGFNTNIFEAVSTEKRDCVKSESMRKSYNMADKGNTDRSSADIDKFRRYLNQEIKILDEEGKENALPIYKVYGWDLDDVSTWKGISFDDESNITGISLPSFISLNCDIDLSGFNELEEFKAIATNLTSIDLSGCISLRLLNLKYNETLSSLNLSDCNQLEECIISNNGISSFQMTDCKYLRIFNCEGNKIDIYSDNIIGIADRVIQSGGMALYKEQYPDKNMEYSKDEKAIIQGLLAQGNNAAVLGWDKDVIASWSGIEWQTISGENHIVSMNISGCDVTGNLDVSGLKYLRNLYLNSTGITALNISRLSYLEWLDCSHSEIERLDLLGLTDNMTYIDCRYNYLDVGEIEEFCQHIIKNDGAGAFYKQQYMNANVSEFNKGDLECLERLGRSQDTINWDMMKPGRIHGVTWVLIDGEYRVGKIDLSAYTHMSGKVDLSSLDELTDFNLSCTMVKEVLLPQRIAEIPEKAFYSCMELEKVKIPGSVDKVGSKAFANCPKLKIVYFEGNSPKSLGVHIITENVFTDEFATVYYKKSTEGWDSSYWKDYNLSAVDGNDDNEDKPSKGQENSQQGGSPQKDNGGTSGGASGGNVSRPGTGGTPSGGSGGTGGGAIQTPGGTKEKDDDITPPEETKDKEDSIKLKPTYIKSVKYKKNKLVIVVKKVPAASGYEVTYQRKKKGKKKIKTRIVDVSGYKNNVINLRKPKKGKYRIKVRTYAERNGKRYYSKYSKVYKLKI